jgi:hypothetical protein
VAQDVFISYAHADHEFVSRLALDLEERGADVWIDRMDIHAGEEWRETIAAGVRNCKVLVLVVSPESLASEWANEELRLAMAHDKPVLPLLYRKADIPPDLQSKLGRYQYINFRRGSYEGNLADLVAHLATHDVHFRDLAPEELADLARRRLLRTPPPTHWGEVLRRVPGWALAWALGWLVVWTIVPIVAALGLNRFLGLSGPLEWGDLVLMPVAGFAGGFLGGLLAGLLTMLALRKNATSIHWRHMSMAIRIWAIGGTIAGALSFGLFLFSAELPTTTSEPVDCSGLDFAECFQARVEQGMSDVIGQACVGALAIIVVILLGATLSTVAVLIIGLVAGGAAVRRIRRLEPGILGRQAVWVVLGWGLGAVLTVASGLYLLSRLME